MGASGKGPNIQSRDESYRESEDVAKMKIYVAGHRGLVGSAIVRAIEATGNHSWIGKTRSELDLLDRQAVFRFLGTEKPDAVIIAAAKVGGIHANSTYPVQFLTENLQIQANLMDAAHAAGIEQLLFLGSSCVYPKLAPQPIKEEYLLTGELEKTNEAYALAKISGLKMVQAYRSQYGHKWISAMPTNMYGPGDNFDLENSHVLPALIRKFDEAKNAGASSVKLWGSGAPKREFLHSDDLGRACLFLLENYDDDVPINVGVGEDISIRDLATLIQEIVGFSGSIDWDSSKPDGTPRKLLDVSKINELGWKPQTSLRSGIESTYIWYREHRGTIGSLK
jgi:GDP-L-fucose synthase